METSRILIADDAEMNREMLAEILGNKYEFVYAENGIEVVDALRGDKDIDLILLDINMPFMDGFGVLRVMNERHWIEEFPVIIISASDSADFMNQAYQLGAVDYIPRPFNAMVVQKRVENTLLMYSNQKRLTQVVASQVFDREKTTNMMIHVFSDIIEMRNHESGNHTLNVQMVTELLLNELVQITDRYNLSKSDVAMISSLSALHDIGKIKIPESILNNPGKLSDEEWKIMRTHTVEGEAILKSSSTDKDSKFTRTACAITRWHHEKYDGGGYPDGLVGDDIPICAQVVSLADSYDALTSERCYKHAFSHEKAIDMLVNGECGYFNPVLIECLTHISDNLKAIKESGQPYDYLGSTSYVTEELLEDNSLPANNSLRRMMDNERKKKDFFMDRSLGVQFEFDKLLNKVTFVYNYGDGKPVKRTMFTSPDNKENALPLKYWDIAREKLLKTSIENPYTSMDAELEEEGRLVPYHLDLMAIWPEHGTEYIFVVGHFTKIE